MKVQVLEVGGRGGVFQHSLAASIALANAGHRVTLHTASDPEIEDERVRLCRCFNWRRESRFLRGPLIALGFILRTVPHILMQPGIIWVQGTFKPPLTMFALASFRLFSREIIFSPHNLFSRYGGLLERFCMERSLRLASTVVTYNKPDARSLESRGIAIHRMPLFMYLPVIPATTIAKWRERLSNIQAGVCAVGQIRADKNLTMLVQAASAAGTPLVLMGEDAGALNEVKAEIKNLSRVGNTSIFEGFFPLEDIAAVVSLTGAVALPYSVASQSGVAALAKAYNAKVIAYATGGLGQQTDIRVDSLSSRDWESALRKHAVYDANRDVRAPKPYSQEELETLSQLFGGTAN